MRELIGPLISVHRLVLFFSDVYCFFDPPVHFVAFSVDHLRLIPIYDMVESDGVVQGSYRSSIVKFPDFSLTFPVME